MMLLAYSTQPNPYFPRLFQCSPMIIIYPRVCAVVLMSCMDLFLITNNNHNILCVYVHVGLQHINYSQKFFHSLSNGSIKDNEWSYLYQFVLDHSDKVSQSRPSLSLSDLVTLYYTVLSYLFVYLLSVLCIT